MRRWFETDDVLGHVPGPADTFYFLGDLGEAPWRIEREMRLLFERTSLKKVAVLGNHDHTNQRKLIARLFDEVYAFPVYIWTPWCCRITRSLCTTRRSTCTDICTAAACATPTT